jgi:uncharacterized protein (DUF305 family)
MRACAPSLGFAPACVALNLSTVLMVMIAACHARSDTASAVQPQPSARGERGDTLGDVRFMQGMIAHHAQAIEMTALIPERTSRRDMALLGERITVSQRDEIAMMQRWLREHGEDVPQPGAHATHGGAHELMPGMLTPDEMTRLRAATGAAFEREFLRLMIKHHEGALTMVARLFSTHGAGQDTEIYFFASDVDADQRAEISRMQAMLSRIPP